MPLTLTCGTSGIGGFVLMISTKRFSSVLRKVMETPRMRIWGVMPCNDEGGTMKDE